MSRFVGNDDNKSWSDSPSFVFINSCSETRVRKRGLNQRIFRCLHLRVSISLCETRCIILFIVKSLPTVFLWLIRVNTQWVCTLLILLMEILPNWSWVFTGLCTFRVSWWYINRPFFFAKFTNSISSVNVSTNKVIYLFDWFYLKRNNHRLHCFELLWCRWNCYWRFPGWRLLTLRMLVGVLILR